MSLAPKVTSIMTPLSFQTTDSIEIFRNGTVFKWIAGYLSYGSAAIEPILSNCSVLKALLREAQVYQLPDLEFFVIQAMRSVKPSVQVGMAVRWTEEAVFSFWEQFYIMSTVRVDGIDFRLTLRKSDLAGNSHCPGCGETFAVTRTQLSDRWPKAETRLYSEFMRDVRGEVFERVSTFCCVVTWDNGVTTHGLCSDLLPADSDCMPL